MKNVLITGGAGFIGTNVADRLLRSAVRVRIFDNLSRPGSELNLEWLARTHGSKVEFISGDVRVPGQLQAALSDADHVFHFAGQVAVTSSVTEPVDDFETNARGTLNVLEAIRNHPSPPSLIFTSTNKVYGSLDGILAQRRGSRYEVYGSKGVSEHQPLEFHSPYGCSKGSADQYVRDYARIYGLRTIVFRMSCIYGAHQFGTEDQGWVAHFLIRALEHSPITIYGDGAQLRDLLFVDDLVDAFLAAQSNIDRLSGRVFNIGGGPENVISLLELVRCIEEMSGARVHLRFEDWRPGDQRYYVSDIRQFESATGWRPRVSACVGIRRLHEWLVQSRLERLVHA